MHRRFFRRGRFGHRVVSVLAALGAVGAVGAQAAAAQEPTEASAQDTGVDTELWVGSCQSPDGRYAATIRFYLAFAHQDVVGRGDWTGFEIQRVWVSLTDTRAGSGERGVATFTKRQWDGRSGQLFNPLDVPPPSTPKSVDDSGNLYLTSQDPPYPGWDSGGSRKAGWWYSDDTHGAWMNNEFEVAVAFSDSIKPQCSIRFGFGVPKNGGAIRTRSVPYGLPRNVPLRDTAQRQLNGLTVGPERQSSPYSRDKFGGTTWAKQSNGCNVRQNVLRRDADDVSVNGCEVVSGRWFSQWDASAVTNPSNVHIDHSVALAEAWRSGADSWTPERRKAFANDTTSPNLMVMYGPANSRKSDYDVTNEAQGRPRSMFSCYFARAVIAVKSQWDLRVQAAEKEQLQRMLNSCPYA